MEQQIGWKKNGRKKNKDGIAHFWPDSINFDVLFSRMMDT